MGLPNGDVTRMAKTKRSTITPMLKRTFAHLFNKPATTKYPFVKPKLPEDSRGKPIYEIKSCNRIALGQSCPEMALDVHSIMGSACSVCQRDWLASEVFGKFWFNEGILGCSWLVEEVSYGSF